MKGYMDYMDSVEVSRELHEKLVGLAAPAKRPAWKKYGAVAAALVLALGAGVLGVSRMVRWNGLTGGFTHGAETADVNAEPGTADVFDIDIAPDPDQGLLPDIPELTGVIGGYEVISGDGPTGIAAYFMLPYIAYGEGSTDAAADYSLVPPDGGFRDATIDDFLSVLGCNEAALADHLGWGGCTLFGNLGFNADGTAACAYLFGDTDTLHFEAELCPGRLPPQCCIVLGQPCTTTDVWGVEVAGMKNVGMIGDGERGIYLDKSLRTEFIAHGVGVRCTAYGTDEEVLAELMSRFVRWAVVEGLDLSNVSSDGAKPLWTEPVDVGEPNWNDGVDLNKAADPSYGVGDETE